MANILSVHGALYRQTVLTMISVTLYGSQLEEGLLSSKYPYPSAATWRGIRIDVPRSAIPEEKVRMLEVSCKPVKRLKRLIRNQTMYTTNSF